MNRRTWAFIFYICALLTYGVAITILVACETVPTKVEAPASPTPTPEPAPEEPIKVEPPKETTAAPLYHALPWDGSKYATPDWNKHVLYMAGLLFNGLDQVEDMHLLCPKYDSLSRDRKIVAWGYFFTGVSKFESSWKPTTWMTETTMGTDPITKKQVKSQGLLQLSYQDIQWAPYCEFDWSKDKNLSPDDPKATINDPYKNLSCGMRIMDRQIRAKKRVILESGVYWSVLKDGGKYQKIAEIKAITQKAPGCL